MNRYQQHIAGGKQKVEIKAYFTALSFFKVFNSVNISSGTAWRNDQLQESSSRNKGMYDNNETFKIHTYLVKVYR